MSTPLSRIGFGFAFALTSALMSSTALAESNFSGHWTQTKLDDPCSLVFGFTLKADGSASVDWVETKLNAAKTKTESHKGVRDGRWSAKNDTLHLTVVEVENDPKVLKLFDKTAPVTKTTNVDATLSTDGKKLNATVKAQKCTYNFDKR